MLNEPPEAIICFVHLGRNPSPILIDCAEQAKRGLPNAKVKLITDEPRIWKDFPGDIVVYQSKDVPEIIPKLKSKNPEIASRAGGYWLKTLERLFVLELGYGADSADTPIIHFESDVWSFVDSQILRVMQSNCKLVSIPMLKSGVGCASILFSPNREILRDSLERLQKILLTQDVWIGDMELLGIAVDSGVLQELPTRPSQAWSCVKLRENSQFGVIFDAAALGQYICGVDPMHTENHVITGFQNPDFEISLKSLNWSSIEVDSPVGRTLAIATSNSFVRVANLHIHSKLSPGDLGDSNSDWNRLLHEARGESPRLVSPYVPELIHSKPPSLIARLQVARGEGLVNTVKRLRNRIGI